MAYFNDENGLIYVGKRSSDKARNKVIDRLSAEHDLNDNQINLLRTAGLNSASDVEAYLNQLLSQQYQTEDERIYNEGLRDEQRAYDENEAVRMRNQGLNPDLLGIGSGDSPIQSEGSIYPDPGNLSVPSGSLSSTFKQVSGTILQLASFGLSAYSTVSSSLMKGVLFASGLASEDIKNAPFNDVSGMVEDVDSIIARGIHDRGLKGHKAKAYASWIYNNINSLSSMNERLKASNDLKDSQFKARVRTSEYYDNLMKILQDSQETEMKLKSYDLEIAKQKEEFIKSHPDYTLETLEAELKEKTERASGVALDNAGKRLDNEGKRLSNEAQRTDNLIAAENLEQEKNETEVSKSKKDVQILKDKIESIRIEGLDEMIEFCRKYESDQFDYIQEHKLSRGYGESVFRSSDKARYEKYKFYRESLRKQGYYKDQRYHLKGTVGLSGVNVGLG